MKRQSAFLLQGVLAMGLFALPGLTLDCRAWDYKEEAKEPVKHTFAAGANTLDVDNVNGSVTVIGDSGNTIRVEGEKIIRASDKQELDRGKKEVTLDLNEKDGVAQVYVNGPFRNGGDRNRNNDNHSFHDRERRNYEVIYNLTIHVPKANALQLRSVNGAVKAEEVMGKMEVRTVNGSVTLTNMGGAGKVETVNGKMTATFRQNPTADSSFKTVNGKIDVTFQPNLTANLRVKTFNGSAYTDFETTAVANQAPATENHNGRRVIRMGDSRVLRVGNGGPELSFETLNGGIEIHKAK